MVRLKSLWWLAGLPAAIGLAMLAPLASSAPDGLEKVAIDSGFADLERSGPFRIAAGYVLPGVGDGVAAILLAGVVGVALVFGMTYGLASLLKRRRRA